MKRFALYCAWAFGALALSAAFASGFIWTVQTVAMTTYSFTLTCLAGAAWFVIPICAVLAIANKEAPHD